MPESLWEKVAAVAAVAAILGLLVLLVLALNSRKGPPAANLHPTGSSTQVTESVPVAVREGPIWRGDFEQGNLAQWDSIDAVPGRITVVHSPVRRGDWAGRFEVRQGDSVSHGQRAELVRRTNESEGVEEWWAWSVFFPDDFHPGRWTIFSQWHDYPVTAISPPVAFAVRGHELTMTVRGGATSDPVVHQWKLGDLRRDEWYDFVFHVRWSVAAGSVALWVNGRRVVPETVTPTLYVGKVNYLKQGNYRYPAPGRSVLYQDEARQATTRAALED